MISIGIDMAAGALSVKTCGFATSPKGGGKGKPLA